MESSRRQILATVSTGLAGVLGGCTGLSRDVPSPTTATVTETRDCIGDVANAIPPDSDDIEMRIHVQSTSTESDPAYEFVVLRNVGRDVPLDIRGHRLHYESGFGFLTSYVHTFTDAIIPQRAGGIGIYSQKSQSFRGALQSCPPVLLRGAGFDRRVIPPGTTVSLKTPDGTPLVQQTYDG